MNYEPSWAMGTEDILGTRRVGDGQKDSRVEGQMEDRQTVHLGQGP